MIIRKTINSTFNGFILILAVCFFNTSNLTGEELKDMVTARQMTLKKVLEIKETDDTFYFKYPNKIYADQKENVYVLDNNRLLKFSKSGNFLRNLVKSGQGPGEVIYISNIDLTEDNIIIHNNNPAKIIWIDKDGELKKEFRLEKNDFLNFSHYYDNSYFFFQSKAPDNKASDAYIDLNYEFIKISADGKKQPTVYSFTMKRYIVRNGGSMGLFTIADLKSAVYKGRYIFLYHTPEYKIKCVDIKKNKAVNEIAVKYNRQEIPEEKISEFNRGMIILDGKRYKKPIQTYFNDIRNLLVYKNNLWVVTSTVDKKRGIRVDVYDFNGKRIDMFYLVLPGHPDLYSVDWCISGNYLYSIETPEVADPKVIKYKIDL